jgi:hypothetical protein
MSFYKNLYDKIIEFRKDNPLYKSKKDGSIHTHHIIQRYQNGTNDESNLILLTVREHKIIHYLLWKINNNYADLFAYNRLGGSHKLSEEAKLFIGKINKNRWINLSKKEKDEQIKRLKESRKNYIMTERHKKSVSITKKYKKHWFKENNPFYNSKRYGELNPMYGKKHTEESKNKQRGSNNHNAKKVCVKGKQFNSKVEAANYFKVNVRTIHTWLNKI